MLQVLGKQQEFTAITRGILPRAASRHAQTLNAAQPNYASSICAGFCQGFAHTGTTARASVFGNAPLPGRNDLGSGSNGERQRCSPGTAAGARLSPAAAHRPAQRAAAAEGTVRQEAAVPAAPRDTRGDERDAATRSASSSRTGRFSASSSAPREERAQGRGSPPARHDPPAQRPGRPPRARPPAPAVRSRRAGVRSPAARGGARGRPPLVGPRRWWEGEGGSSNQSRPAGRSRAFPRLFPPASTRM